MTKRTIFGIVLTAVLALVCDAAPVPTIQASSSVVNGQPGSVVGWGFTLTYTANSDWVLLNDSFFAGSQVYGTYQDYVVNQFIVAGPSPESSTVTVPFSLRSTGLGEFDINSKVPYTSIAGNIVVDYSIFSQDPNSPTFDPGSFVSAGQASTPVTVNIAPEPRTAGFALLGLGLAAMAFERVRRSRLRQA